MSTRLSLQQLSQLVGRHLHPPQYGGQRPPRQLIVERDDDHPAVRMATLGVAPPGGDVDEPHPFEHCDNLATGYNRKGTAHTASGTSTWVMSE